MMQEKEEEFWSLVAKKFNKTITQQENERLELLIEADEGLRRDFLFMQQHWDQFPDLEIFAQINPREDWAILQQKIAHNRQNPRPASRTVPLRQFLSYAAAIMLLISMGGYFMLKNILSFNLGQDFVRIEAPLGSRSLVNLPDGTIIWLNAGSSLEYNNHFNHQKRQINLQGEAFFDVAKSDIPLRINALDINIEVLGTSFNIKAYPDDQIIETTLVSGSLRIEKDESSPTAFKDMVLKPNEKAVFHKADMTLAISSLDAVQLENRPVQNRGIAKVELIRKKNVEPEISWRRGVLIMDNEELESLAKKLERRYDVTFVFTDSELLNYRYSGQLPDFTLEQVMYVLKLTSPLSYEIDEKKVFISLDRQKKSQYNKLFNQ